MAEAAVGSEWKQRKETRANRLRKLIGSFKKRLKTGWERLTPGKAECKTDDAHQKLQEALQQDLQQDFQQDFLSTCEAMSNRLLALKAKYPDQPLYKEEEFAETRKQFSEKQVLISVLGSHGSGKSTLLNALLDCRLLPMSVVNETALKIHIQNHEIRAGASQSDSWLGVDYTDATALLPEQACPKLVITCDGQDKKEVNGVEEIYGQLTKLNKSARTHIDDSCDAEMSEIGVQQCRIFMSAPILDDALPNWNVSLVDTPGFGEDDAKISAAAAAAMSASSACVYVTNSRSLRSKTDADCYKELHKLGVVEDGRLVIVVTKFDENYGEISGKVLNEEEAQQEVVSAFLNPTCTDQSIPFGIFVVSGLWAHIARELRKSNHGSEKHKQLIKAAKRCLSLYPDEGCGEQEDFEEHLRRLSSEEIAKKLERASGIFPLEGRIRDMAMKCADTWISKMHSDYRCFLNEAKMVLVKRVHETLDLYNEKDECCIATTQHYSALSECQDTLKRKAADDKSPVYEAIAQAYDKDLQAEKPEVKGKQAVNVLLEEFAEKCRRRIKNKNDTFGQKEFEEELQQFTEDVRRVLESTFNGSCRFTKINETLPDCVAELVTHLEGMKRFAEKLSEAPNLPKLEESDAICYQPDEQSTTHHPTAEVTQTLDEAMKVRNLGQLKEVIQIPPVDLTYWDKFIIWWRSFVSALFEETSTEVELQEELSESCDDQLECDAGPPSPPSPPPSEHHGWKAAYKSPSALDEPISILRKHIMTTCDNYCNDIKPYVVHHFFDQYRKRTNERLNEFESEYGACIQKRLLHLQELAVQLEELDQEIGEVDAIIIHLARMIQHLEMKAEEFKKNHAFM